MKLGPLHGDAMAPGRGPRPELTNLIEQVRVAKRAGLLRSWSASISCRAPCRCSRPCRCWRAYAAEAEGMRLVRGCCSCRCSIRSSSRRNRRRPSTGCATATPSSAWAGYLPPGGVRFDRRALQGARAALRRGRRGDPQDVRGRRRRASRPPSIRSAKCRPA